MSLRRHIPNTITSLNLACGTAGIAMVSLGQVETAFILMLAGAVADFCDGLAARALDAYSPMGKELDSIADTVTFGVLPAFMLFTVQKAGCGLASVHTWIPLLIAVFSGLRLAKFNVDERQTSNFLGMPTPICAMFCGSLAAFLSLRGETAAAGFITANPLTVTVTSLLLCYLLVSEIPMFSMKIHKGNGWDRYMILRTVFGSLALAGAAVVCIAGWHWTVAVLIASTAYLAINLLASAFARKAAL